MTERMTKRTFLRTVGAAAGAGAVYQTMQTLGLFGPVVAQAAPPDLPAGSGRGKRVAILGAGISGMVAAWELSKAGYRCEILEATRRVGGRSLTVRAGDVFDEEDSRQKVGFDRPGHLYANLGPARIPHHHTTLLGYCREFAIPLEVFTNDNRAALFHNRDRFAGKPQTGRRVRTDLRGYVAELLAKAVDRNALDDVLTAEDKERVLEMLVRFGGLDAERRYAGSNRGGYLGPRVNAGLEAGEVAAPLDLDELLRADFWRYKLHFSDFLNQNPTMFQPVGGMDAIAEAFRKRVGHLVRYRRVVREIRRAGDGARVVYRDGYRGRPAAVEADYVVCTLPATVLAEIANDFAADVRAAVAGTKFLPSVKIALQARRRFWEEDAAIYGGISWTDRDVTQIWYPAHGYHGRKGVLMGAYIWSAEPCMRYAAMTPDQRIRAAVAEGGEVHPGYADEIETGVSMAWSKRPFQKGAWPKTDTLPVRLREPDGPFHFAGDQVSALPGWQEGAALAAHAAVEAIAARTRAG